MKRQRSDLRIAILISGELRNWNDTADHLFNLKEVLERDYLNTTIDVYGHTWTHSYTANLKYKDRFADIFVEDQDIIFEWVSEDIVSRASLYYETSQRGIKITTKTDMENLAKNSKHNYAQTAGFGFGAHKIPLEYDYIIRTRWDNEYMISRTILDETMNVLFDDNSKNNIFLSYQTKINPYDTNVPGLNNLFQVSIQDHYFIISKTIHEKIKSKTKFHPYEVIMSSSLRSQPPMDHGMWAVYLGVFVKAANGLLIANLPHLANIVKFRNGMTPNPINNLLEE
jgi:hypothetical protein